MIFNNMLRSARNQIECAFGRLKSRWRILSKTMDLDTEHVPSVVYACFVLHNFCESRGVHINPEAVTSQMAQETREQCCEHHHDNISVLTAWLESQRRD